MVNLVSMQQDGISQGWTSDVPSGLCWQGWKVQEAALLPASWDWCTSEFEAVLKANARLPPWLVLWETHFEMETGHNGQLLHGELLCGLLIAMATATLDLGTAS